MVLITAQGYFVFQNYRVNQQRFINDVQIALDLSIEKYFSDQARSKIQIFTTNIPEDDSTFHSRKIKATISSSSLTDTFLTFNSSDSIVSHHWSGSRNHDPLEIDSIIQSRNFVGIKRISSSKDSSRLSRIYRELTDKVMLSFSEDLIDLGKLYETVESELARKNLVLDFSIRQESYGRETTIGNAPPSPLTTTAKSSYLGINRSIEIDFENATLNILKRGIVDLTFSLLIVGLVVGTMLHLYSTINKQKQLAEIKDDLISNITHEFKTPIATIFSALEGVMNFNETNDQEKTRRYLTISNDQLKKLNATVEKLLETATIDKGKLVLNREEVELVGWTKKIVEGFREVLNGKTIDTELGRGSLIGSIDLFHFENALVNLIDNAVKYGGNQISIRLYSEGERLTWEVEDNGGNIPKHAQEHIFEKLYRIPTGNIHDVKGFGIGLYYARTIAELHNGALQLEVMENKTLFRLTI